MAKKPYETSYDRDERRRSEAESEADAEESVQPVDPPRPPNPDPDAVELTADDVARQWKNVRKATNARRLKILARREPAVAALVRENESLRKKVA